jgi:hypothetical protein
MFRTLRRSVYALSSILLASVMTTNADTPDAVAVGTFYGAWSPTTTYSQGSIVTSGGSSYISIHGSFVYPNKNHLPQTSAQWWSVFATQSSQGVSDLPRSAGGMVVKDSNGTIVGPLFYTGYGAGSGVAVKVGQEVLVFVLNYASTSPAGVPLLAFGLPNLPGTGIFYTTSDCSGVAYGVRPHQNEIIISGIQLSDDTNFYPLPAYNAQTRNVSFSSSKSPPDLACVQNTGNLPMATLGSGTPLSTLGLVPPFTVQLH